MKFPLPISEMNLCDCGRGDWKVTSIEVDDQIEHRFKTLLTEREQKHVLKELKRRGATMSKKQYFIHRKCESCGFIPPPAQITENMLKKMEIVKG